jgi:hypothetical protein
MVYKFRASEWDSIIPRVKRQLKEGASYILEIKRAKDKRSLNQNKYYWGIVVGLISKTTGYSPNEAHQELARMFLEYEKSGKHFIKSTTELNTGEAEQYFEKCRLWAWHELEIKIPLPNEITEEVYMQLQNIYSY